ncbi:MAG: type II secretion system protein, partial [Puniceicoccales bacterium]
MGNELNKRFGFSLIELLVVIAVLGVLAAILFPVVATTRTRAGMSDDISKQRGMAQAVLLYNATEGHLPGRFYRAIRIPSSVEDSARESWFSSAMADWGYMPQDDESWEPA